MRRKINSAGTLSYISETRLKFKMMSVRSNYNCQTHNEISIIDYYTVLGFRVVDRKQRRALVF